MGTTAKLALPYPELTDTADVPRDVKALADKVDAVVATPTWHLVGAAGEPGFQNGWVNAGGVWGPAAFCKYADGVVRIRGAIKTGTIGTAAFTLPAGYRPPAAMDLPVVTSGGLHGRVEIENTGNVLIPTPSNNALVGLDGITFDTAP